jgi:hypothetical protein
MREYSCYQKNPDSSILCPLAIWAENTKHAAEIYGKMAKVGEEGTTVYVVKGDHEVQYHVYIECVPEVCVKYLTPKILQERPLK